MLTAKRLRDLLECVEEDSLVRVVVVGAEDAHKLLAAVQAPKHGEGVNIRVTSPLPAVEAYQADNGGVLIFAFSPEE